MMKNWMEKSLVLGLVIICFLIPIIPVGVAEPTKGKCDLTILDVNTFHSLNRKNHYALIIIMNFGKYSCFEDFMLSVFFEVRNTETGICTVTNIPFCEFEIDGLGGNQIKFRLCYRVWINPDEDVWQARFIVKIDLDDVIDEEDETNNDFYGVWFPPYD